MLSESLIMTKYVESRNHLNQGWMGVGIFYLRGRQ